MPKVFEISEFVGSTTSTIPFQSGVRSDDLTAMIVKGIMVRNKNIPIEAIEDMVVGCAFPEGSQGMLISKGVAILSDLSTKTAAKVVNRFCGSAMDAVHQVSQSIVAGDYISGIAGGVEDMFGVPMGGYNPDFNPQLYEKDYYIGMGETAENLATDLKISREEQEEFAINSHKKALRVSFSAFLASRRGMIKSDSKKSILFRVLGVIFCTILCFRSILRYILN